MPLEDVMYLYIVKSLDLNTVDVPTITLETDSTISTIETSKENKIHESPEDYNWIDDHVKAMSRL